jgi:RNA recognition motif-containing protein
MHLYVEGIPAKYKEADVKALFEAHGKVSDVKMIISNITKLNKGFAYVIMPVEEEATKAIETLHDSTVDEKVISVSKSSVTAAEGIKLASRHGSQKGGGPSNNFSQSKGGSAKGYSGGGAKAAIPKGGSNRGK